MANVGDENVSKLIPSLGDDKIGKLYFGMFKYFLFFGYYHLHNVS